MIYLLSEFSAYFLLLFKNSCYFLKIPTQRTLQKLLRRQGKTGHNSASHTLVTQRKQQREAETLKRWSLDRVNPHQYGHQTPYSSALWAQVARPGQLCQKFLQGFDSDPAPFKARGAAMEKQQLSSQKYAPSQHERQLSVPFCRVYHLILIDTVI